MHRSAAALTLVLSMAVSALVVTPATAAPTDDGLWYYSAAGMDDIHRTSRGEGITIAILDTQINPDFPDLAGTRLNVHEPSYCAAEEGGPALPATSTDVKANHGTGITSLIIGTGAGINGQPGIPGVAPDVTINYYAVARPRDGASGLIECPSPADHDRSVGRPENEALLQAIADGADIISFSTGGQYKAEHIASAQRAGIILVGSAGNLPGAILDDPAAMNGVIAVGSVTPAITVWENSPSGPGLAVVAPGVDMRIPNLTFDGYTTASGASLAAPFTAGALALAWSQHPDATANQMIQTLLRTTGGSTHGLQRDDAAGYGLVSAERMLTADPSTFPDENPMLFDATDRVPLVSEVLSADATTSPTPTATAAPPAQAEPQDDDTDDSTGTPIGLIAGIAGVIALALILTVVLIGRRRSDATTDTDRRGGHDGYQG
jgi:hypothetical protein